MTRDPLRTRLCDEYGCAVPIVAFNITRAVVAEACRAGGIGVLACTTLTPDEMREDIRWLRDQVGDRPFGIDLTIPSSYVPGDREELEAQIPPEHRSFVGALIRDNNIPDPLPAAERPQFNPLGGRNWDVEAWRVQSIQNVRRKLEIIMEERVPIFASGLGSPAFILDEMHTAGVKVWGLVGLGRQAQRELEAGIDVVIAQGGDAGGHAGRIGTFSLVPEVVDLGRRYDRPILAAGGVTTGRHIAAALMLGAAGVWTGTLWTATAESNVDPLLKERLLRARNEDAWITRAYTGKPSRRLRNKFAEAWEQKTAPEPLEMPLQEMLVGKLLQAVNDHRIPDWLYIPTGQGVGHVREVKPTRQVIDDLVREARETLAQVSG